jgi:predicted amidophosphoribosyltransferase
MAPMVPRAWIGVHGRELLGLLAPPRCLGCHRLVDAGFYENLCPPCRGRIAAAGPVAVDPLAGIETARAATEYTGPARRIVAALKSGRAPAAAATAAELIAECLPPPRPGTVVVPVGAAIGRRLLRGLDPAAEIALALGLRLGAPTVAALARRDRRRQRGRRRELRIADPPRFRARGPAPDEVLLVDDVLTTGGTLRACAAALRAAGSDRVGAVAFARTPPPGEP